MTRKGIYFLKMKQSLVFLIITLWVKFSLVEDLNYLRSHARPWGSYGLGFRGGQVVPASTPAALSAAAKSGTRITTGRGAEQPRLLPADGLSFWPDYNGPEETQRTCKMSSDKLKRDKRLTPRTRTTFWKHQHDIWKLSWHFARGTPKSFSHSSFPSPLFHINSQYNC